MTPMLVDARGLRKTYSTARGPIAAVDGVDLQIVRGELVAICGRSGSGKSTLLGMLGGLCRPTEGTVTVDGVDLGSLRPHALAELRARRLGFVFQFPGLLASHRAVDNVALPAVLDGMSYPEAYDRARDLLSQVGLGARWDAYPGELSGGQQRRVAIARALVNRPVLILADEPTNDLDEQAEREVMGLLFAMHASHSTTLVVVTHDQKLASLADRVVQLSAGKVLSVPSSSSRTDHASSITPREARRRELVPLLDRAEVSFEPDPPALVPAEPTIVGEGLGSWLASFVGWTFAVACALLAFNYAAAHLQRRSIAAKTAKQQEAEQLALQSLRADVDDVVTQPDGSHVVGIYLQSFTPEKPLYVLGPSLRVFVQIDRTWQPLHVIEDEHSAKGLHLITSKQVFPMNLRADVEQFDELVKGYMHLRIHNVMVVGESADGTGDLFQRTDDYYIYLKAPKLTDDEIRRRNGWKEGAIVPRWIAMPAH
jgi:ABC-type lipoprotein export system ATPase subunit